MLMWATLLVYEMHHRIPTPGMADRVFTILVASAAARYAPREFVTVTVPLDALPASMAPGTRWGGAEGAKVVRGAYVAVERVRCVSGDEWRRELEAGTPGAKTAVDGKTGGGAGGGEGEGEYIFWDMATTADAGGSVPGVLQKMGLASHVVVDVGLMLSWVEKRRQGFLDEE
jgi:hypothetical protein